MFRLIKNVLIAVDGSKNSDRALDFGLDLAEKYGAVVTALNVSDSPPMGAVPMEPTMISGASMGAFSKNLQKFHEETLNKAVAYAKSVKPDVVVFPKFREGHPSSEIVAEAKEGGFDVVVVGHRGSGRVREMFMGSVSEKVVHSAPCSVIIVR